MREDKVLYIKYEYLYHSAKKLFQKLLPSSITRPIFTLSILPSSQAL